MGGGDFSAFWSGGDVLVVFELLHLWLGVLGLLWRFLLSLKDLDCKADGETACAFR